MKPCKSPRISSLRVRAAATVRTEIEVGTQSRHETILTPELYTLTKDSTIRPPWGPTDFASRPDRALAHQVDRIVTTRGALATDTDASGPVDHHRPPNVAPDPDLPVGDRGATGAWVDGIEVDEGAGRFLGQRAPQHLRGAVQGFLGRVGLGEMQSRGMICWRDDLDPP